MEVLEVLQVACPTLAAWAAYLGTPDAHASSLQPQSTAFAAVDLQDPHDSSARGVLCVCCDS